MICFMTGRATSGGTRCPRATALENFSDAPDPVYVWVVISPDTPPELSGVTAAPSTPPSALLLSMADVRSFSLPLYKHVLWLCYLYGIPFVKASRHAHAYKIMSPFTSGLSQ